MFCARTEELLSYSFILLITVVIIVEKNIKIAFKKSLSDWLTKCGAWGRGGGGEGKVDHLEKCKTG